MQIYDRACDSQSNSYGQRERCERAVQSFAVQPSLLLRVRELVRDHCRRLLGFCPEWEVTDDAIVTEAKYRSIT